MRQDQLSVTIEKVKDYVNKKCKKIQDVTECFEYADPNATKLTDPRKMLPLRTKPHGTHK